MKPDRQDKKNNFAKIINLSSVSVLSLLVFISGILFSSHSKWIKDGWAGEENNKTNPPKAGPAKNNAGAQDPTSENETCLVSGIFYDQDNPRVLINEELFTIGGYCCGGKITRIFADLIVLEFPYGRREYKLGDSFRREKVKVELPKPAPKIPPSYVKKVNSLVESFMASHNQYNSALNMQMKKSLFADPDEAAQIRVRAYRMLELIQEKKRELAGLSAPDNCKRHYSLTIKLFDIAEDGWKAVSAGNKDKAEVFFDRLLRISQEISRESVSILARQ